MERMMDGRFRVLSPAGAEYVGDAVDCRELMIGHGYTSPPGTGAPAKMTPQQMHDRIIELEARIVERDATTAKLQPAGTQSTAPPAAQSSDMVLASGDAMKAAKKS